MVDGEYRECKRGVYQKPCGACHPFLAQYASVNCLTCWLNFLQPNPACSQRHPAALFYGFSVCSVCAQWLKQNIQTLPGHGLGGKGMVPLAKSSYSSKPLWRWGSLAPIGAPSWPRRHAGHAEPVPHLRNFHPRRRTGARRRARCATGDIDWQQWRCTCGGCPGLAASGARDATPG